MPPTRVVLFDLDGTITDSGTAISNGIRHALGVVGVTVADDHDWGPYLGPPLRDILADWHELDDERADAAVAAYVDYYREHGVRQCVVYGGIPELLGALRATGVRLAIATSKRAFMAEDVVRHFGLDEHFEVVGGAHADGTGGRKHDVITRTLGQLGVDASTDVVMIGDRQHDIRGAKTVGVGTIGVRWGYAEPGELEAAEADVIVDTVADLRRTLVTW